MARKYQLKQDQEAEALRKLRVEEKRQNDLMN